MKKSLFTLLALMLFGFTYAQNPYTSYYDGIWDSHAHADNANLTCAVYIDDVLQSSFQYEVGAYDITRDNELVGRGMPRLVDTRYIFFTSYMGETNDEITFRLYDHVNQVETDLICTTTIVFIPNNVTGNADVPYELRFYSPNGRDMLFTNVQDNYSWSNLMNWTINGQQAGSLPNSLDRATIDGICVVSEDDAPEFASLTIKDGAQFFAPEGSEITATVEKEIAGYAGNNGNWYLIAKPGFEANEAFDFEAAGMFTGDYDLFYFDQLYPGSSIEEDEDYDVDNGEWRNYKYYEETDDLESFAAPYGGYLYANKQGVTLSFESDLNTDAETTFNRLTFDGSADVISQGLNLVGNPYTCNAQVTLGNLMGGVFMMNEGGTEILPVEDPVIAPTTALIAKATQRNKPACSITFTPAIGAEATPVRSMGNPRFNIEVRSDNGVLEDRVYVRNYESVDLVKFNLRNDGTKIYIPQNGMKYAAVYAGEAKVMPINFTSTEGGIHTISVMTENMNCNYLHLIDNVTGTDIDLLRTPKYSFNADDSHYATRFKLVFDEQATNEIADNFAFISNGELMINNSGNATLQVMDITGRILSTENIQNCYSKSLNLSAGVYVVRLSNGNDVKAQKIVVE